MYDISLIHVGLYPCVIHAWIMSFLILVGSTGAREEKKRDLAYLSLQ